MIFPGEYHTPTGGLEHKLVPVKVGGRDGLYDELIQEAVVQVAPGIHVEFEVDGPSYPDNNRAGVDKILADISWGPDPGYEATWPPVTDWAK